MKYFAGFFLYQFPSSFYIFFWFPSNFFSLFPLSVSPFKILLGFLLFRFFFCFPLFGFPDFFLPLHFYAPLSPKPQIPPSSLKLRPPPLFPEIILPDIIEISHSQLTH
ncbi:hypothetical protein LguiA_030708 [Lonicera macranthoides]